MVSLWLNQLPEHVEVGGKAYRIHIDFRIWVQFENLLFWSNKPLEERITTALCLCYADDIPPDGYSAMQAAIAFYSADGSDRNEDAEFEKGHQQSGRQSRIYSFSHDAALIYAAFRSQYGIDLNTIQMHWWQFNAMFSGLEEECKFSKVMGFRAMDLSTVKDKEMKAYYKRMKRAYRLPDPRSEDEKEADMMDAFASMF